MLSHCPDRQGRACRKAAGTSSLALKIHALLKGFLCTTPEIHPCGPASSQEWWRTVLRSRHKRETEEYKLQSMSASAGWSGPQPNRLALSSEHMKMLHFHIVIERKPFQISLPVFMMMNITVSAHAFVLFCFFFWVSDSQHVDHDHQKNTHFQWS